MLTQKIFMKSKETYENSLEVVLASWFSDIHISDTDMNNIKDKD